MHMKFRVTGVLAVLAVLGGAPVCPRALADEIVHRRIALGVTITGAEGFSVLYRIGASNKTTPVAEITRIELDGVDAFNQAEVLVERGKPAQALSAYREAIGQVSPAWKKRLVRYRLLRAMDQAGRFAAAIELWAQLAAGVDPPQPAVASAPSNLPARGSPALAGAIETLETAKASASGASLSAVRSVLIKLYRQAGRHDEAAELASRQGVAPSAGGESAQSDKLTQASAFLDRGEPARAVGVLKANMNSFQADRPAALLLLGKAQWAIYSDQSVRDRKLVLSAGLNFMRVVAYYPQASAAPEALVRAAEVNRELGNAPAGRAALRKVLADYPESPFADQARKRLSRTGGG